MKKWLQSEIAVFLIKAAIIYIIWYLVYDLWLLPDGRLPQWMAYNIVNVSAGILQFFHYPVYWIGRLIGITGTNGLLLVNGCTGISQMGLFIGFIIAYPGRWVPRICYIILGTGIIYLTNIARIITLALIEKYHPSLFNFTHHYSATAIFYLVIFILWVIWVNLGEGRLMQQASLKRAPAA
jgi:exosortase/archaeosortase family protein